jgi:hypothetical protein
MGYILADGNGSKVNFDLGLGSRLFCWASAYYCADICNYTVVIPDDEWAEFDLLDLPNTILMNREDINTLNWEQLIRYDSKSQLLSNKYWRIKSKCDADEKNIEKINDPLWKIKFKSDSLNSFFDSKFDDHVGFHLRRWHGVGVKQEKVNDLLRSLPTAKIRKEYYDFWIKYNMIGTQLNTDPLWIVDKTYYKYLDKILEVNPKQKIYLSTDIPKELYGYYKKKYKTIEDKYCYIDEWLNLISKEYDINKITNVAKATIREVAIDLLDLFALGRCKYFLLSVDSQWGGSAYRLKKRYEEKRFNIGIDF